MTKKKRQPLPSSPAFYCVATPIGNLSDLSPRAREILAGAAGVFCEDTRVAAKLFQALEISPAPRFYRCDENIAESQLEDYAEKIAEGIAAGDSFALISDAGTPGISDPGAGLLARLHARLGSARIYGVPGPSAVTTLLSIAGFGGSSFAFYGFFPRDARKGRELIQASKNSATVGVWFESPQRIGETLNLLKADIPDHQVFVAKELTKLHEKHYRGTAIEVADRVRRELDEVGEKGEWCFAVKWEELPSADAAQAGTGEEGWTKALQCLINAGVSVSESARQISQVYGIQKRQAYDSALKLTAKKS